MPRSTAEQIFRGLLRGPLSTLIGNTNPWAGRTDVTTASATSSVATTQVDSDSIILLAVQQLVAVASGLARGVRVSSINPGVGFTLITNDAVAPSVNMTVMWTIFKTQ